MNISGFRQSEFDLYRFQLHTLPILLGWAISSVIVGLLLIRTSGRSRKSTGWQFILWGLIDGVIAGLGLRAAQSKGGLYEQGVITPIAQKKEALAFERIVWLNALLDVLYVLFGSRLIARSQQREDRRGMGWGILIQGAFLLVWDIWLGMAVHEKRHSA